MWSRYCKVLTYSSSLLLAHLFSYPFSIVWHLPTNIYSTLTQPFLPDNPSRADLTLLYPFLSTIYSTLPHPFLPDNPSRADLTLLFPFLSTSYFTSDLMYCTWVWQTLEELLMWIQRLFTVIRFMEFRITRKETDWNENDCNRKLLHYQGLKSERLDWKW